MKITPKGDGKMFKDAVDASTNSTKEIRERMIPVGKTKPLSNGTFFNLYGKEIFTEEEKAAAAKALNKPIREIFSNDRLENLLRAATGNDRVMVEDTKSGEYDIRDIPNKSEKKSYPIVSTSLSLPPAKNRLEVFDFQNNTIKPDYFEKIKPTWENRNGWIPFVGSFYDLLDQYPSLEQLMKDNDNRFWPMHVQPVDMMRFTATSADFIATAPATKNMMPVILPASKISVKYTLIDEVEWGKAHAIIYHDGKCEMYFIRKGRNENEWLCKSLDAANYDDFYLKIQRVRAVFEIIFPVI